MPEKRIAAGGGSLNGVPVELLLEILVLLPVKTLVVLRSVCKWLLSMIDDPLFVSSHLHHNNHRVPKFLPRNKISHWSHVHSSVDGLVLLINSRFPCRIKSVMLYNPSIGRKRILDREWYHFALGYKSVRKSGSSSSRQYRVLGLSWDQAWVYSVELDTWTDVTLCSGLRGGDPAATQDQMLYSQTLCRRGGSVVWSESIESLNSFRLVCFNFRTRRFRYSDKMPLPVRSGIFEMWSNSYRVGVWKIGAEEEENKASVFALQTDTMTLIPLYTIPRELVPFSTGPRVRIDPLLVWVKDGKWFSVYWRRGNERPGDICETASRFSVAYDLKTHAIRHCLQKKWRIRHQGDYLIGYYVESLIMV